MATLSDDYTRHRTEPRISANELARYMVAGELGKIGIISRARDTPTALAIRYKDVRKVLRNALMQPSRASGIIEGGRETFTQRAQDGSVKRLLRDDAEKSLDVLDTFPRLLNEMIGHRYQSPPQQQAYLVIAGVNVSVNLDLVVSGQDAGDDRIGGLIFRLTKPEEEETDAAKAKRRDMGLYVATLVHMQVTQNFSRDRRPHRPFCWSVDVQNAERFPAPSQYRQRERALEAACRMIAASWQTL